MSKEWTPADLPGLVIWVEGGLDMLRVVNGQHPPAGTPTCASSARPLSDEDAAEVEKYLAKRWGA